MSDPNLSPRPEDEATARRKFLGHVARAAVTAPAVALLVASSSRSVAAQYAWSRSEREPPRRRF
jgi:hypothetical protein